MQLNNRSLLLVIVLALPGCSRSLAPVPIPEVNKAAGQDAIGQYDSNGDQAISDEELKLSPALRAAFARLDANKDKKISADEINQRIDVWRSSQVGMTTCTIVVRMNGQPLEDAQVKMVPEPFLGEQIKPAQGISNRRGMARMRVADDPDAPGAHQGLYRVEISKMVDGKETVPTRYNSQSELGMELAADVFDSHSPLFNLQDR